MEKTMARAIYKRMEIGKAYTTRDLYKLLPEEEYYSFISTELYGKDVRKVVADEMWKVVKTGYAKTYTKQETVGDVRGRRFGTAPTGFTTYTFRCWKRVR